MGGRTRLVVDGMNVIGSRPDGWWRDRDMAVRRFLRRLQTLAAAGDDDIALVLDGRPLDDVGEGVHDGVRVLYARRHGADAADDRIIEELETFDHGVIATVVTSDRTLAARAHAVGATVVGAQALLGRLDELEA